MFIKYILSAGDSRFASIPMTPYFKDQLGLVEDPTIRLNLSQPQHTDAGYFLGWLYYSAPESWLGISKNNRSGYPHNGGMHTLYIHAQLSDVECFLAWLKELEPRSHLASKGKELFIENARKLTHEQLVNLGIWRSLA